MLTEERRAQILEDFIATHFDCLPTEGEETDKENFTSKGYQITMNDLVAKLDYCIELSEEIKKFTDREN